MPSPFPGMDPYLEDPARWPGVHLGLIAAIRAALNRSLRPKYQAVVEERVYLSGNPEDDRPPFVPDVRVTPSLHPAAAPLPSSGRRATEPVLIATMAEAEIHEPRVEIVEAGTRVVVTVIEVLSPTNKRAGGRGRRSYLRKRREVMRSSAHWVEIDLLRAGQTTFPRTGTTRPDYAVHVSPTGLRPLGRVWPAFLPDPLPVIGIPLREPDPDANLDLQAVVATAYDDGGFDLGIDYRAEPVPPLPPDLAAWADGLLRERGLRTSPPPPSTPPV